MLRSTLPGLCALVLGLAPAALAQTTARDGVRPDGVRAGARLDNAGWAAPRTDGPRLRVVSDEPTAVTVEVTATWPTSLADAAARATDSDGVSAVGLAAAAAQSQTIVSYEVALGAAVPPAVEIVSEDVEWIPLTPAVAAALSALDGPLARVENVSELRRQLVGSLAVRVLRVEDGRLGRVRSVVVRVPRPAMRVATASRGGQNPHVAVTRSALADGQWVRIAVPREGVYRLTTAFLRDSLGVASPDLSRIQVYGNGGRILPAVTTAPRPADLVEVPTLVSGDALLFFGEGPAWWDFVPGAGTASGVWQHDINPFTDAAHYFVRLDAPAPRRLATEAFPAWADAERLATIADRRFHERDRFNQERDGSGSGLDWMGEEIQRGSAGVTVLDAATPGGVAGPIRYRARVASRTSQAITITMNAGSETLATVAPNAVVTEASNIGDLLSDRLIAVEHAAGASLGVTFRASGGASDGKSWLDWAEAVVDRAPTADGGSVRFATPGGRSGRFEIALQGFSSAPDVWDVTTSGEVRRLGVQASGGAFLVQVEATDRPREIVAFDASYVRDLPGGGEPVANQNLHGLGGYPAYVVVAHPEFAAQAERLAAYRRSHDGLESVVVTTDQIFNEFASGTTDMRAVRDYMKFLYDRAPDAARLPRYLLLFGDGHFDYRNIGTEVPNFVPVYETENMFNRTNSYTTDDYFGVLADGAGVYANTPAGTLERVQVGIGRLPVRSAEEAEDMVDKIQLYESPESRGEWRSRATYIGDDQYPNTWDQDLHVLNADGTSQRAAATDPTLTIQKIYAPTFPLVRPAGNNRRPAATEAVVRSLNEGTLVWNYSGHGSPENLGDERYFTEDVLASLDNRLRPSIFVTATCSFGKYDIDEAQSMAEQVLLLPEGGGIAMFTTVRVVYTNASPTDPTNYGLNLTLTQEMFTREAGGRPQRLGDILYRTKNTSIGASLNNRKFNLLGDPAMRIGLPERRIAIQTPAEFRAFDEATVTGQVLGADGLPDAAFSGEVDVAVFDALRIARLPPSAAPFVIPYYVPRGEYTLQTDALYAGRASVRGGQFSATFRVPQDVSYSGLPAKVFVYAAGGGAPDASGASLAARVSAEAGVRPDDGAGPTVRLFLGDTTFVSGGLSGPEPILLARLSDASGINTVGAGVGHELLLTIDGDASTAVDVGRYYAGDLDTYRSGTVRYPLPRLAPGPHVARLTAWDAVNNAASAEVSFTVSDAAGLEVRNVFPYPNPTAGPTRFTFEHNLPAGTPARVQLRIFSIAGRVVRTIDGDEALPGGILTGGLVQIPWDGRDDDLDRLATGIYLYRLRIEADGAAGAAAQVVERVERLAIIR